jgi:hypothetical protein
MRELRRALEDACRAIGEVSRTWCAEPELRGSFDRAGAILIRDGSRAVAMAEISRAGCDVTPIVDAHAAAQRAARDVIESLRLIYEERWAQPRSVLAAAAAIGRFVELVADDRENEPPGPHA